MKGAGAPSRRAIGVARQATGRLEWPPVAGVLLGLAAMLETALRSGGSGVLAPMAVLVGLCATVPLAFVRGHGVAAGVAVTAATLLTVVLYRGPSGSGLAALLAVWLILARRRLRNRRAEAAEQAASRQAVETRLRELSVRGERARIARELHDVVAHHISMISVQAETARLTIRGMPEEGARHLRAIGDTARAALTEMHRLLGLLREDAGAVPTRAPQPGLQQLLELTDKARASGRTSTRVIIRGEVTQLDPGVELTAYRIVQEALTNARRHAPGSCVDVDLDYAGDALRLRVRDNGPGPPQGATSGHGLLGMRERVAAVGGALRTGSAPGCGFLVEAILPAGQPNRVGAGQ